MTKLVHLLMQQPAFSNEVSDDLDHKLWLDCRRLVIHDPASGARVPLRSTSVRDAIYSLPQLQNHDTAACLDAIINGFGGQIDADTPLTKALEIKT